MSAKPQIDDEKLYVDDRGQTWTTFSGEGPKLGVHATTISDNLPPDAATLDALNTVGSPIVLHLQADMQAAVDHLVAIAPERIVTDKGIFTTSTGRNYASAPIAAKYFVVEPSTIRRIAGRSRINTLKGRDQQGVVTLFSLEDLAEHPTIKARISRLTKVDERGHYVDQFGVEWSTVDAFYGSLPADIQAQTTCSSIWLQAKKHCRSMPAIDRTGRPNAEIFPVEELKTKALALVNEPFRVNPKTGYYSEKDENGKEITRWATKNAWLNILKVSKFALNRGLKKTYASWENVPRHRGLSQGKKPDWLYSEEVIRQILAYIFEAEIQSKRGFYIQEKKVYKSALALSKEVDLTAENIKRRLLKAGCPTIDGVDRRNGGDEELFDYETFRTIFAEQIRVILNASDSGDLDDPHFGRCLTLPKFYEENPEIKYKKFLAQLKSHPCTALRRRDPRTNRIENFYPEKTLKSVAAGIISI